MNKGLDGTGNCTHIAAQIKAAGYGFVCRYSSHSLWKNMTRNECLALSAAGLYIVNVWETDPTHASYFTHEQGVKDANDAHAFAQNVVGQPHNTPIYFAVDTDVSPGVVEPYFQGIKDAFATPHSPYAIGAYGGGTALEHLLNQSLIGYAWLANARGWGGYQAFRNSGRWNLLQTRSVDIGGLNFDGDMSQGHGGGWQIR